MYINSLCIYYYHNGIVSETYNYVNGLREGRVEIFFPSGDLNMKGVYSQDKLHGFSEFYYDITKELEAKGKYLIGVKDSVWVFYSESGDTLKSIDYRVLDLKKE
mgnify:CR=1 FL=1